MATGLHYTCCIILLASFVDRGDGRWKRKDRENLRKDIELFRNIADKIDYEIETFYEEYSDERLTEDVDGIRYRYTGSALNNVKASKVGHHAIKPAAFSISRNDTNEILSSTGKLTNTLALKSKADTQSIKEFTNHNEEQNNESSWPRFADILLEMGKQYDWKNDRWIKVKRKMKNNKSTKFTAHNLDFHVKHKFYYRVVKLSKSKNRRNVVVAVSAVR